jgi:hypothetical protein
LTARGRRDLDQHRLAERAESDDRKKVGKAIGAMITEAAKSLFLLKLTI